MNWFQQNRWLGTFLIVFGVCFLVAGYFLFSTKSTFDESFTRFNDAATERSRLERLDPFPSETNYKKMKVYVDNYVTGFDKLKEELKTRVLPAPALAQKKKKKDFQEKDFFAGDVLIKNSPKFLQAFRPAVSSCPVLADDSGDLANARARLRGSVRRHPVVLHRLEADHLAVVIDLVPGRPVL